MFLYTLTVDWFFMFSFHVAGNVFNPTGALCLHIHAHSCDYHSSDSKRQQVKKQTHCHINQAFFLSLEKIVKHIGFWNVSKRNISFPPAQKQSSLSPRLGVGRW